MRWQSISVKSPAESAMLYKNLFAARVMTLKDPFGVESFFLAMGNRSIKLVAESAGSSVKKSCVKLKLEEDAVLTVVDNLIRDKHFFQMDSHTGEIYYADNDGNTFEIGCIE